MRIEPPSAKSLIDVNSLPKTEVDATMKDANSNITENMIPIDP